MMLSALNSTVTEMKSEVPSDFRLLTVGSGRIFGEDDIAKPIAEPQLPIAEPQSAAPSRLAEPVFIQLAQLHAPPNWRTDQGSFWRIVESQMGIANFIRKQIESQKDPESRVPNSSGLEVIVEGLQRDYSDPAQYRITSSNLLEVFRQVFPRDIPTDFRELSLPQAKFLYRHGAAMALFCGGQLEKVRGQFQPEDQEIYNQEQEELIRKWGEEAFYTSASTEIVQLRQYFREEAWARRANALAIESQTNTIILIVGNGHDLQDDFENIGLATNFSRVTTCIPPIQRNPEDFFIGQPVTSLDAAFEAGLDHYRRITSQDSAAVNGDEAQEFLDGLIATFLERTTQ